VAGVATHSTRFDSILKYYAVLLFLGELLNNTEAGQCDGNVTRSVVVKFKILKFKLLTQSSKSGTTIPQ
jgi:hypothetical protein